MTAHVYTERKMGTCNCLLIIFRQAFKQIHDLLRQVDIVFRKMLFSEKNNLKRGHL